MDFIGLYDYSIFLSGDKIDVSEQQLLKWLKIYIIAMMQ